MKLDTSSLAHTQWECKQEIGEVCVLKQHHIDSTP